MADVTITSIDTVRVDEQVDMAGSVLWTDEANFYRCKMHGNTGA
jgi:hypothetical protein